MAYTDPGTYITEQIKPRAAITPRIGFSTVIIGEGKPTKIIRSEEVVRGLIVGEPLTVAATTPFVAALLYHSDENQSNATLYADGVELADDAWEFSDDDEIIIRDIYYREDVDYTLDYIGKTLVDGEVDNVQDALANTIQSFIAVGNSSNNSTYKSPRDFVKVIPNKLDWDNSVEAAFTGIVNEPYDTTGGNNLIGLSFNGLPKFTVELEEGATEGATDVADAINDQIILVYTLAFSGKITNFVIGETLVGNGGATGVLESVLSDNGESGMLLLRQVASGPFIIGEDLKAGGTTRAIVAAVEEQVYATADYATVASPAVDGYTTYVKITAPTLDPYYGNNSSLILYASEGSLALSLIFGLDENAGAYTYWGTGSRPAFGQSYYVTYTITRPDADYNAPRQFFTDTDFFNDIGYLESTNPLALAGAVAWSEAIQDMYVIQVKDSDNDGIITDQDYVTAIAGLVDCRGATDICCLRSTETTRAHIRQTVSQETALSKCNYKRAWLGVPRDTLVGDAGTPGTIVYIARQEIRPTGDDVCRGRFILTAPTNWLYDYTDLNGKAQTLETDSSMASVMKAARTCSFPRASDSLFRKRFAQMRIETNYADAVRRFLSSNGVDVMVQEGWSAVEFDSLTTDGSGDYRYEEPSVSTQKDLVAFDCIEQINDQLMGIVPDDPADMVANIKVVVGGVLLARIETGDIGYFLDNNGAPRDIDYAQDIVAFKDAVDARTYRFGYFIQSKVPSKRFWGQFSIDFPYFVTVSG